MSFIESFTKLFSFSSCLALVAVSLQSSSTFADGACCLYPCGEEECVIVSEAECAALDGEYLGAGSVCEDCPIAADVPDPGISSVLPPDDMNGVVLCPSAPNPLGVTEVTVRIEGVCGPFANSPVEIILSGPSRFCDGSLTVSGVTNVDGEVTLVLDGGGCTHEVFSAAVVKASGVTLRQYSNAKSPDVDGNGEVTLGDLVPFSEEFLGTSPSLCHDYDNSGNTGIEDLVFFAAAFLGANHCP